MKKTFQGVKSIATLIVNLSRHAVPNLKEGYGQINKNGLYFIGIFSVNGIKLDGSLESSSFIDTFQNALKETWAVFYSHGGIIAEFDSEPEAREEAERWTGVCFRLNAG
ncbi:hypothetical protein IQ22_02236 [Pseudomonas duriflava]|uniref:Uncharacterized protein n=1 Tax=Pseudomonas duriflava TaxID=459528 RepID=A0A562QDX6_9PSED|nr:hypothetical protein [Pseudomonas duriflava]TWI54370.1 hypothetical protein IQ22_02236 [Pseudomonas duriflava]